MNTYRILSINPGSGSTKVALFENEKLIFQESVYHDAEDLKQFNEISDELPYRTQKVLEALNKHNIPLQSIDAFSGRAGGLVSVKGGVYKVNEKLLEHAKAGYTMKHQSSLGVQIAYNLAKINNKQAYTVNPVTVDELQDISRITGLKGVYKNSIFHALNQKEVAYQYAKSINKKYESLNLIVVHLGTGITIGAHKHGKVIDVNNALTGEGPFTPSRTGVIDSLTLINMCFSGKYTKKEIYDIVTKKGGLIALLGTNDVREVIKMIDNGDKQAKLVLDAMIYQISKQVAAYSVNYKGNLDAIILTGAIAQSEYFVSLLKEYISYLAEVVVIPGEKEMEALSNGALRVLNGEEEALTYSGEPIGLYSNYMED
ncbi:MAG: butyrate kinase [Clostridia bacterium]|nr:butyrate kinase [Clostridia bacterium]